MQRCNEDHGLLDLSLITDDMDASALDGFPVDDAPCWVGDEWPHGPKRANDVRHRERQRYTVDAAEEVIAVHDLFTRVTALVRVNHRSIDAVSRHQLGGGLGESFCLRWGGAFSLSQHLLDELELLVIHRCVSLLSSMMR
ncbi:MAG: hypothetical protein WBC29_01890 [Candidatus Moraniibacteriota bacterium]